jgi:outer membrane protein
MKHTLFFLLLIGTTAFGQGPLPADLKALIQQAGANYPVLKQQEQQIQAGSLQADIVRSALKPNVTGNASYQYLNPVAQTTFPVNGQEVLLKFQPNHNVNANVTAGQTLYDFGRTDAAVRRAGDNLQLLRRGQEVTRHNLAYQVAAGYYGVGFIRKSLVVQDSVIKTASNNVRILATRLQNGDALQFDVLSQQVRLKTAQNRRIDLQNQLERQLALLTYLTGNLTPTIGPDAGNFGTAPVQPFVVEEQLQTAIVGNKDVLTAQDRVKLAETDIKVDDLQNKPSLSAQAVAGFRNGYVPDVNVPRFNVAVGVSFTAPLYAGRRYELQNQAARLNLNASRYAVENANAQLRQSLAGVNADIRANQTRLQNLDTQVLQARKALELAQTRLRNGVITPVELESAETGIEEALLGQLAFQYQLLINQLELKRLAGDGLE